MSEATYISWSVDRLNVTDAAVKRARSGDNSTVFEITNLARPAESLHPDSIIEMLASALRAFDSVSAEYCPFEAYVPGESRVHGDACLPNITVADDGSNGYIDLGDMEVGDVEVDLSTRGA